MLNIFNKIIPKRLLPVFTHVEVMSLLRYARKNKRVLKFLKLS